MNLVGKILTGIICFFCVILMAFVLAVYAAHTNWKAKALALQAELQKAKDENKSLQERSDKAALDFSKERQLQAQVIGNLEAEKANLTKARDELTKQKDDLEKARAANENAMVLTQKNCESLHTEVLDLRKRIKDVELDREDKFKAMVKATDDLNQAVNLYNALRDRTVTLARDLADAKAVLLKFNLTPNPANYGPEAPADLLGRLTAVRGDGLVEIDLGSDQGLSKSQQLDVIRKNAAEATFLGRVEVTNVEPARSVAKILPEFQKGVMEKGDLVVSNAKAKLPWSALPDKTAQLERR